MRFIIVSWLVIVIIFWGWFALSANDVHFGVLFLKREFHDGFFNLYSQITGIPADELPIWLAWVFFIDGLFILGLACLRWYKLWLPQTIRWSKDRLDQLIKQSSVLHLAYDRRFAQGRAKQVTAGVAGQQNSEE